VVFVWAGDRLGIWLVPVCRAADSRLSPFASSGLSFPRSLRARPSLHSIILVSLSRPSGPHHDLARSITRRSIGVARHRNFAATPTPDHSPGSLLWQHVAQLRPTGIVHILPSSN